VKPQLTAFAYVPPFAQGYVRDLRLRWALEEVGVAYEAVLVDGAMLATPAHRQWQPFGQVPAYRDDEVELFESGAIVLHIAGKHPGLAPADAAGLARVTAWVIAALNSIEPHAQNVIHMAPQAGALAPKLEALLDARLTGLSAWLDGKPYLEGDAFTAGDLMMAAVLRELEGSGVLARFPILSAYTTRCITRPAFARALEAQLAPFREHAPA
jgi:glutathione S-transferase